MLTIDRIPKKVKNFFRPLHRHFTGPAWGHFWAPYVSAILVTRRLEIEGLVLVLLTVSRA